MPAPAPPAFASRAARLPGTVVTSGGHAAIRVYGPAQGGCF
jgi:hypothetical protein